MRALAVLLVLGWHAEIPSLSAGYVGVDIFFVISGYLITGVLLRSVRENQSIGLITFYSQRVKRLLPLAIATTLLTFIGARIFVNPARWSSIGDDAVASALYLMNWRLAGQSIDYVSLSAEPSLFQHFWSLSVEEQFYFVWPIICAACLFFRHPKTSSNLGLLRVAAFILFATSLIYSIHYAAESPGPAYFSSLTRTWQLVLGGILALYPQDKGSPPRFLLSIPLVQTFSLAAIVASAFTITSSVPYPGAIALVPCLGIAVLLVCPLHPSDCSQSLVRLLTSRPIQFVGTYSYGIYLLHWPMVVLLESATGDNHWAVKLTVSLTAIPLSYILTAIIERPIRANRVLRGRIGSLMIFVLSIGLALTGSAVLARQAPREAIPSNFDPVMSGTGVAEVEGLSLGSTSTDSRTQSGPRQEVSPSEGYSGFGAEALGLDPARRWPSVEDGNPEFITPDPVSALSDSGESHKCTTPLRTSDVRDCRFGEDNDGLKIALIGDSHAQQWWEPLKQAAESLNLSVQNFTMAACPYTQLEFPRLDSPFENCWRWNDEVQEILFSEDFDVALFSSLDRSLDPEELAPSYKLEWERLLDAGVQPIAVVGSQYPAFDVPACVIESRANVEECAFPSQPGTRALELAVENTQEVRTIDLGEWICPASECPVVIANVLVYRDDNHLTDTFSRSLASEFTRQLGAALSGPVSEDR